MSKTGLDDLSERLIAADSPVSDAAYQKYRMQLEDKLKRAERMQRRAWWTMIGLWIVSLLSVALVVQLGNVWRIKMPEWYGAFHGVLVIVTWVETIFYFARYRPRVLRLKDERQMAFLQELSQKVSDLTRRLDEGGGNRVQ